MNQSLLIANISHIDFPGMNQSLLIAKISHRLPCMNHNLLIARCAHLGFPIMNQSLLIAKRAHLDLARMPQRNAPQSCGASQRPATPRHALATRISRTRYAQRPERDLTAGEINESNAMQRRNRASTFQSTAAAAPVGPWPYGFTSRANPSTDTSTCSCPRAAHVCVHIKQATQCWTCRSLFARLPNRISATLRQPAAPRNASHRLASRLQHASRGLDTLNGRSATLRPEGKKRINFNAPKTAC